MKISLFLCLLATDVVDVLVFMEIYLVLETCHYWNFKAQIHKLYY